MERGFSQGIQWPMKGHEASQLGPHSPASTIPSTLFPKPSGGLERVNQLNLAMISPWAKCHRFPPLTSQDQPPLPVLSNDSHRLRIRLAYLGDKKIQR